MSPSAKRAPLNMAHHPRSPASPPYAQSPFSSRRSTVYSTRGVVCSAQPLASSAGVQVLERGGNAADAAVAVAAALNVTEPSSTGIGGDAFCLYWDAKRRDVRGLNGSGRSPAALTLDVVRAAGVAGDEIPLDSVHSVTVPGAAAAWCDTVKKFGSGKLGIADVLQPAIRLAEKGYPVHEYHAQAWQRSETLLKRASPNASEMLHHTGRAPLAGEIVRHTHLARTLRELASKGAEGFYKGRVAEAIVEVCQSLGGKMSLDDLAHHVDGAGGSEEVAPIEYTFGETARGESRDGVTIHECPPNGQGLVALEALGVLDELVRQGKLPDPASAASPLEHNSAPYLHALIESLRLGFADAREYVADPDARFGGGAAMRHVERILSPAYLAKRAQSFDPRRRCDAVRGEPENRSDTVYLSVVDEEGNACSFINSNYAGFGSGIVPRGCGFTLQNRGAGFVLREGHANCLEPRKRPYHTIIPAMATKWDEARKQRELWLCYGVMGGFMQGHVQVLLNLLRGMTPQDALDAPRFCIGAGTPDQGEVLSTVYLEQGIRPDVVAELRRMGHDVEVLEGWERRLQFGRGQVNMRIKCRVGGGGGGGGDEQGEETMWAWAAGSDPRADGQAIAQV